MLRNGHDLVIKPAENPNYVERIFGSDDMQLLRKCPCPVWLMQPTEKSNYECIMAAVDFDTLEPETVGRGLNMEILERSSSLALSDFAALHFDMSGTFPRRDSWGSGTTTPKQPPQTCFGEQGRVIEWHRGAAPYIT